MFYVFQLTNKFIWDILENQKQGLSIFYENLPIISSFFALNIVTLWIWIALSVSRVGQK
jgi:hypothetical protein